MDATRSQAACPGSLQHLQPVATSSLSPGAGFITRWAFRHQGVLPRPSASPAQPRTARAAAQLAGTHRGFWAAGGRGALGVPFCHGTRSGRTRGFGANGDDSAHAARANQGRADTACPFCLPCTARVRGGSFAAGENLRLLLCVPSSQGKVPPRATTEHPN